MELTKRSIYDGYIINYIYCEEGNEYIDFTSKEEIIRLNHAIGEVNEDEYKRLQIRKTIEEHLDKELRLTPMGIKVLSLFFIDKVSNYRDYDAPDTKGKYARMFEEEYAKAIKKPKYNSLFSDMDTDSLPELVHEGYFEEGIRFGVVTDHLFANIVIQDKDGNDIFLGAEKSEAIHKHLLEQGYIDSRDKVTDALRVALKADDVVLPKDCAEYADQIVGSLKKIAGGLNIKNNDDKRTVQLNKAVFESAEFKELWEKVKYKTTYNVDFDPEELIKNCAEKIKNTLVVGKTKFTYEKATAEITRSGVDVMEMRESTHLYDARDYKLPDILSYLQNETNLKRRSILDILLKSERLESFKNNPQKFIDEVKGIIKREMSRFVVDGIKYQKIGEDYFYAQELFENEELIGYLNKNMIEAERSIYDHVVYDSDTESKLAQSFEINDEVKVYAKLPSWFKIDTPLGTYNPDWAVLMEMDGTERLYFVVETKNTGTGTVIEDLLKASEQDKIACGRKHFEALNSGANYVVASDYDTLLDQVSTLKNT